MKRLRLWLLVVLAVLLPIRGAVAAAMLCPPMGSGGHTQRVITGHQPAAAEHLAAHEHEHENEHEHEHAHEHGHGHQQAHEPPPHHHGQAGHHDEQQSPSAADECNLCAAFCSVTPVLSSLPTIAVPPRLSTVTFPDLAAPNPSFFSGGQDRPPRTT